jgi:hypothetical protein
MKACCAQKVAEIFRLRAELAAARKVIEPLLDHYMNCYDGNADQLVYDTRSFLEREATPPPVSPER